MAGAATTDVPRSRVSVLRTTKFFTLWRGSGRMVRSRREGEEADPTLVTLAAGDPRLWVELGENRLEAPDAPRSEPAEGLVTSPVGRFVGLNWRRFGGDLESFKESQVGVRM